MADLLVKIQSKSIFFIGNSLHCLSLSTHLGREKNLTILGLANNLISALDKLKNLDPEFVILDPSCFEADEIKILFNHLSKSKSQTLIFSKEKPHAAFSDFRFVQKPQTMLNENFPTQEILQAIFESSPLTHNLKAVNKPLYQVMLIDDSALMKLIVTNLMNSDPQLKLVCDAKNGQEGLELLQRFSPDLILLDIEMPVMNGIEFLERARSKTKAKIIVLSSIVLEKAQQVKALGADAIIEKPDGSVSLDFESKSGKKLLELIHQILD
ncbi:hypothetical protein COW36_16350 [bacterium (Candidatus Blackallbacteria) CG17_big_fil_post_rev_8_21_14_2_50_48_46]|uniref:Response regulatory domain-containing protein n=1 Tax=bacterium (Candidatus Blackallbacteria) CG17_big_fil_post_rev_8_21_14_2_50_48_46 TaxID=2014261 RepID=A0A2M7G1Q9_9BACT|nr:MAG: hypothetical protein COW64_08385 [bacterium (Candidatus Blackallbacteria) CG18_big_fil_WC_8_21_14_2_50_49_26]PIW15660.1 MAG: hypothetical protein COW36_16350 [bacterium (Candidatus Blackallbacteria) CG17_big_fil_post_rev_8_21_14_2_50_48_46]PIW47303.1 MAG: hypothetical protein COW20_13090 [bacterium (Candidatus Blackallbacteria) CG13_big_fil_rev_8_21_14_2_50_49_14]